jgi:hypothetical protein
MGLSPGDFLATEPLGSCWGRVGGERDAKQVSSARLSDSSRSAGQREMRAYLGVEVDDAGHASGGLGSSDSRGGGNLGRDEGGEARHWTQVRRVSKWAGQAQSDGAGTGSGWEGMTGTRSVSNLLAGEVSWLETY